jgi:large subunit ribosomal protein L11
MSKTIKLQIEGGNATPGPPVGTALGSQGVNTRDFCLQFNAMTQKQKGKLLRVFVHVTPDKKFTITVKGSPTTMRIKEEVNVKKGSSEPNRNKVGTLSRSSIEKIVEEMGDDLRGFTPEAKYKIIEGTARSMGVKVNLDNNG